MVGPDRFLEVYVDTALEVGAGRDVKGLYAGARKAKSEDDRRRRPV